MSQEENMDRKASLDASYKSEDITRVLMEMLKADLSESIELIGLNEYRKLPDKDYRYDTRENGFREIRYVPEFPTPVLTRGMSGIPEYIEIMLERAKNEIMRLQKVLTGHRFYVAVEVVSDGFYRRCIIHIVPIIGDEIPSRAIGSNQESS